MMIRKIRNSEVWFLSEMLYEALFIPEGQDPLPETVIAKKPLSKYVSKWGSGKYDIAIVAEKNSELIGAIWGRMFTEQNKGFGYVDNQTPELSIAVKPEFRNLGIGTRLLTEISRRYQEIGIKQLSLSVDKANRAYNLYVKLGFEIVDETPTSWTMIKKLS